jgi:hypothetical protein
MLSAGRVAARIVQENRPGRANLLSKKLHQRKRRFVFETQPNAGVSEQAYLDRHAELIAGAALRQNEIPVGFAERIKPDQGAIVVRRSEQPLAIGVIQEAPSRHCIL